MNYLGIDIGGTNTAFALVNDSGEILETHSLPTTEYLDPKELLLDIHALMGHREFVGIGMGCPNGNSKTGSIEFAPNLRWSGVVKLTELAEGIFRKPAHLVNDANAAALGEWQFGCAKDWDNFVTITLGTGLGSGVISEGKLVEGAHGLAGEYGHIIHVPNGRPCGCGRLGCLETYVSAQGVMKSLVEWTSAQPVSERLANSKNSKHVFDLAEEGDPHAESIVDFTANELGRALANFTCFSDPTAFVLFGGLARSGEFFRSKVEKAYRQNQLPIYNQVKIVLSTLPAEKAAILGAAGAAKSKFS